MEISYAEYRKHMEKLSFHKKKLSELTLKRQEHHAEYRRITKEINELRKNLFNLIPDRF